MSLLSEQSPAEPPDAGGERVPTEEEVAAELEAAAEEMVDSEERRYPSTIGGAIYLVVLAAGALGIAIAWGGDWRLGIRFLAGALCFAALLRLVLPTRDAGMLAVRNRWFDGVLLGGVGVALFFLAATIPGRPG